MSGAMKWFVLLESLWLFAVLLGGPIYASLRSGDRQNDSRALNLPRGSIRALLALVIVGSFAILLVFAPFLEEVKESNLDKVIVAFGTLTGAVTGFYFGGRASAPSAPNAAPPKNDTEVKEQSPSNDESKDES